MRESQAKESVPKNNIEINDDEPEVKMPPEPVSEKVDADIDFLGVKQAPPLEVKEPPKNLKIFDTPKPEIQFSSFELEPSQFQEYWEKYDKR